MKECGHRLFDRVGRQAYCSKKCNDRATQRESRARKAKRRRTRLTSSRRTIAHHRLSP
jgi:hypothetical protein